MSFLADRWKAIQEGVGVRRFVIGSMVLVALGAYAWIAAKLEERGVSALTGVPTWAIGAMVALGLLFWWMVEYAVRLRSQLAPKLCVEFKPDSGGIVMTPIKETKQIFDPLSGAIKEVKTEYQAVYVRGLVTAATEKEVGACSAYLTGIRKKDPKTMQYTATQYLDDIQLNWSHIGLKAITIPKGVRRHFDIVDVHERRMQPNPCGVWPLTLRKVFDDHTSYQLDLLVAGEGISERMTIEFTWAGDLKAIKGLQIPTSKAAQ